MLLLADSGATKTKWVLANTDGEISKEFSTMGFSPLHHTEIQILSALNNNLALKQCVPKISQLRFFGTGCSNEYRVAKMKNIFSKFFIDADIIVEHDMLAAAIALCHNSPGIACILGTGSNSIYYDGKQLKELTPALDYVLADEGSGTDLGKRLIKLYLYQRLPSDLLKAFENDYKINKELVLQKVYKESNPKKYLASFSIFIRKHIQHPLMQQLVADSFNEFLYYHVEIYSESKHYPVHFMGSIAYYFKEELSKLVHVKGLRLGKVIKEPIYELLSYYSR